MGVGARVGSRSARPASWPTSLGTAGWPKRTVAWLCRSRPPLHATCPPCGHQPSLPPCGNQPWPAGERVEGSCLQPCSHLPCMPHESHLILSTAPPTPAASSVWARSVSAPAGWPGPEAGSSTTKGRPPAASGKRVRQRSCRAWRKGRRVGGQGTAGRHGQRSGWWGGRVGGWLVEQAVDSQQFGPSAVANTPSYSRSEERNTSEGVQVWSYT